MEKANLEEIKVETNALLRKLLDRSSRETFLYYD